MVSNSIIDRKECNFVTQSFFVLNFKYFSHNNSLYNGHCNLLAQTQISFFLLQKQMLFAVAQTQCIKWISHRWCVAFVIREKLWWNQKRIWHELLYFCIRSIIFEGRLYRLAGKGSLWRSLWYQWLLTKYYSNPLVQYQKIIVSTCQIASKGEKSQNEWKLV